MAVNTFTRALLSSSSLFPPHGVRGFLPCYLMRRQPSQDTVPSRCLSSRTGRRSPGDGVSLSLSLWPVVTLPVYVECEWVNE